jgi:hypothetical protein
VNFRLAQRLASAACAIAAIYLLSILVTGGYAVNFAGVSFNANKLWPAIVAMLGFGLLRLVFKHGSVEDALRSRPGFFIFSLALIVFLANGRTISGGDSVPAKNLPLSILLHGNFYLDQLVTPGAKKIPYYLRESGGHYVSDYPVGAALMALPFYVPSIVCGVSPSSRVFAELEKVSAATIVALSAMLLYLAAARVTTDGAALMLTLIYAFGTSSLSVSSQALWQHGPAQLALTAALYCLIRARDDPRWAGYAGLPLAFEVITRPADALIATPLGLYVLISYRREIWKFIATAIAPLLFQVWYGAAYFGSPLRLQFFTEPAAVGGQTMAPGGFWTTPLANGLAVALLSPGRGLLFYSPIFIFSFVGLALAWRRNGDMLLRYLGVGVILSIMLAAKWHKTSGGASFGPRLLADITPIMALALFPLADSIRNRRGLEFAFVALGLWSITANLSGAFINYRGWNEWALDDADHRLWRWGDNPVVDPFRSTLDSIRIALGHRPTSRNSPDQLDALLLALEPLPHDAAAGARVHVSIRATNIGKAVWLARRSPDEQGMVSLGWEWRQDGKVLADSEVRRGLRLDVFPNNSTELDASAPAPDAPGRYELAISLEAEVGNQTTRSICPPLTIPITVTPSSTASAGVR